MDKETYKKDYNSLNLELTTLKENKYRKPKIVDINILNEIINTDFFFRYYSMSKINRRRIWVTILDKIIVEGYTVKSVEFAE